MKNKILIAVAACIGMIMLFSCGNKEPNDKLKIEDKTYTINLGEINYDAETSLITIEVLADGNPMPNITQYRMTTRNIGEQEMIHTSSSQLVKVALMVKARRIFPYENISSEDGIFTFKVEEAPDIIEVFTDTKDEAVVYFNAKTKEIMSSKEYDLYMQELIKKNRSESGIKN
ncbi:MAG: hypothetical protein LBK94_01770 [Prevotellaceae bacterium]|jgi:hypothetical protein|nr:hypothetical protein [Prevotellaceae bacterium]